MDMFKYLIAVQYYGSGQGESKGVAMEEKICKICGSIFRPKNNNQKCCREVKHTNCKVCGQIIDYICGDYAPPNMFWRVQTRIF